MASINKQFISQPKTWFGITI